MTWIRDINCAHHQQDTNYYCGAATAQMILNSIGGGLLDQDVLYNDNHSHNTRPNWYTDPDGLTWTLNHYGNPLPPPPGHSPYYFVPYRKDTEPLGSEKIVYTLWKYEVPTGTLVYHCGHWIVVRGVSTDVEPAPGATYSINGFWINNPWPYCPSFDDPTLAPPPLHSNADGCGSGGNRGIADEYVDYANTWKDTYFTGCDVWGVGYPQFVSVCDPEVPKLGKLSMKREPFWAKGEKLIKAQDALKFAQRGVEVNNLLKNELFAKALKGANPETPILVQRLDLSDSFYYITPMKSREGVTAFLSVDGILGNFRGGQVLAKPVESPFISREDVRKKVLKHPVQFGEKLGRIRIREGAFCHYPIMVWKPCKESRSPYYPFQMITVGSTNIYIGYDGAIYPELHDLSQGG